MNKETESLFSGRDLTADESAELKMALKRDPVTDALRNAAERHPIEATEALMDVENGHDWAVPLSWVGIEIDP